MQQLSEADQNIECSGHIMLECGCGDQLTLLGLEEDWRSEQRMSFECSCGKRLPLRRSRLAEDVLALRSQHRGTFKVSS